MKDAKPHSDTGLAAVLLGAREGYRVFYHDERRRVHLLTYADGVNRGEWAYGGVVTGADVTVGRALVAQFSSTRNTSLVYVKDGENAGVSRFNEKGLWYSCEFVDVLVVLWICELTCHSDVPAAAERNICGVFELHRSRCRSYSTRSEHFCHCRLLPSSL